MYIGTCFPISFEYRQSKCSGYVSFLCPRSCANCYIVCFAALFNQPTQSTIQSQQPMQIAQQQTNMNPTTNSFPSSNLQQQSASFPAPQPPPSLNQPLQTQVNQPAVGQLPQYPQPAQVNQPAVGQLPQYPQQQLYQPAPLNDIPTTDLKQKSGTEIWNQVKYNKQVCSLPDN